MSVGFWFIGVVTTILMLHEPLYAGSNRYSRGEKTPKKFEASQTMEATAVSAEELPDPSLLKFKPVRVAVLPFENRSHQFYGREALAGAAEAKFHQMLSKVGGIRVVERRQTEAILKEIGHSLSELYEGENIQQQIGKLGVADFLITGGVDQTRVDTERKTDWEGKPYTAYEARGTISIRAIDVATGEVIFAGDETETVYRTGQTMDQGGLLEEACAEAAEKFRDDFQNLFPLRGYIINLSEGRQGALINLGQVQGVTKKRTFEFVRKKGTRNLITQEEVIAEEVLGTAKVEEVMANTAWLSLPKKLRDGVKVGDAIRSKAQKRQLFGGWH